MANNVNKQHEDSLAWHEKLGLTITDFVGTMLCASLFTIIALISLPGALATKDTVVIVGWFAQTFLQLVLLSIILVGQNLQQRHSELRSDEDFRVNQKAEAEIQKLHEKIDKLLEKQVVNYRKRVR